MTSKDHKRQYDKVWAKVSRARKIAATRETKTLFEVGSTAGSEGFSLNQPIEEEDINMVSDTALTSFESEEDTTPMLKEELSEWPSMFHVKHNATDALLTILKRHGHADLPQTARTLFDRSNKYEVNTRDGVDIIKLTVSDQLSKHLSKYPTALTEHLQSLDLSLNIDGLPLFKSSNLSIWPVLCSINLTPACIFPLCLSTAASKPKTSDFVSNTVQELAELIQNGLTWKGKCLNIQLRCVTCDAPAKAMVKCVKQFFGYYGCDRCTQRGSWDLS